MISDEELAEKVREKLVSSDGKMLESAIRKELEQELGQKLNKKKNIIRQEIENFTEDQEEEKLKVEEAEYEAEEDEEVEAPDDAEDEEHEVEDEVEEEDQPKPKTRARSKRRAAQKASSVTKKTKKEKEDRPKKTGASGFSKPVKVSTELADFIGRDQISRPDLTKFMWAYFKEKGLQDPSDKRHIISDEALKDLLKVDRFNAFGFMKLVKPHIIG
eukprot:g4632.t1